VNLFEKQNKSFAIKLSERVKEEIKKEFGFDYTKYNVKYFIYRNNDTWGSFLNLPPDVTLITEAEFFGDGNELTPMQELISKLHPNFFTEEEANYYLEREKQVIEDACIVFMNTDGIEKDKEKKLAEAYYNQNFRKDE